MKTNSQYESEFDEFFSGIGYRRVSDLIGKNPKFKNADYVSKPDRVIVELKLLEKDYFGDGGIIHRHSAIVPAPFNMNPDGTGQYKFFLPPENREGNNDIFEEPLRRVLKKANRQIRETNNYFFDGDGMGFLFLAIGGEFMSICPTVIERLVGDLLSEEFGSIDGFILGTPNYEVIDRSTGMRGRLCKPNTPCGCPEAIQATCLQIGEEWCKFASSGGHAFA